MYHSSGRRGRTIFKYFLISTDPDSPHHRERKCLDFFWVMCIYPIYKGIFNGCPFPYIICSKLPFDLPPYLFREGAIEEEMRVSHTILTIVTTSPKTVEGSFLKNVPCWCFIVDKEPHEHFRFGRAFKLPYKFSPPWGWTYPNFLCKCSVYEFRSIVLRRTRGPNQLIFLLKRGHTIVL